jgi:hypothetical protein
LPCPNPDELLARDDLPINVYAGMTLEMLIGPTKPPATSATDSPGEIASGRRASGVV